MLICQSLLLELHLLPQQDHLHQDHHSIARLRLMTIVVKKIQLPVRILSQQQQERIIWECPVNVVHPSKHHVLLHHLQEKLPLQQTTLVVFHLLQLLHVHDHSTQGDKVQQTLASYRLQATRAMVMMFLLLWVLLEQENSAPTA